jgi:cytochrome c biogenesis protein CcmG, thiol:disulfide interchange protein DsbE
VSRFLIPGILFVALAGVLFVGVVRSPNKSTQQSALLGKPAPDFDLPSLANASTRVTRSQLAGRPWVLNVWGTWCAECRIEHDTLLAIARQDAVPLIGLNWKDDDQAAKDWLTELGDPYAAIAVDRDGRTAIDFGVYGAPETFFIDEHGVIQYRHVGAMTAEVWEREFLSRLPRGATP